jgi:hypothetical protein
VVVVVVEGLGQAPLCWPTMDKASEATCCPDLDGTSELMLACEATRELLSRS